MEDSIRDLSELPDFRKMEIEKHGMPKNWGFCRGYNGLERDQWAIQHVHEDLSSDIYPLPLFVTALVRWERNDERQTLQRSLKALLDID
jgi:hypothetical protein